MASFRTAGCQDGRLNPEEESGVSVAGFNPERLAGRPSGERPAPSGVHTHVELLDGGSAALVRGDDLHLHDLDGVGSGTVASSHVSI